MNIPLHYARIAAPTWAVGVEEIGTVSPPHYFKHTTYRHTECWFARAGTFFTELSTAVHRALWKIGSSGITRINTQR